MMAKSLRITFHLDGGNKALPHVVALPPLSQLRASRANCDWVASGFPEPEPAPNNPPYPGPGRIGRIAPMTARTSPWSPLSRPATSSGMGTTRSPTRSTGRRAGGKAKPTRPGLGRHASPARFEAVLSGARQFETTKGMPWLGERTLRLRANWANVMKENSVGNLGPRPSRHPRPRRGCAGWTMET